jgi:hypothetical protein
MRYSTDSIPHPNSDVIGKRNGTVFSKTEQRLHTPPATMSFMTTFPRSLLRNAAGMALACLLLACTPKFDWREVQGAGAPYSVMLPAKPASQTRPINLDGVQVMMTMTAAEAGGVTFAVGTAELPDAAAAQKALAAMKAALVRNIGGTVRHEKPVTVDPASTAIEIDAVGAAGKATDGQPRVLLARFIARDRRVYQLVATGGERAVPQEAVDTFFTSFKPG